MSDQQVDQAKRTWLIASSCAGAIGGVAAAVPFVSTFAPSERAKAAGAAVEVDISAIKPDVFVGVGICSHLGCSPSDKLTPGPQPSLPDDWQGGFLCPCHGSTFDMAGRVFKNKPAPDNLEVPPHMYLSDSKLLIGEDKKA